LWNNATTCVCEVVAVIDPDGFISAGFVYKGIGRGDKNEHRIVQKIKAPLPVLEKP